MEQELRKFKEEFDFVHKKIGELEWKKAILYKDGIGVRASEMERIDMQLEIYTANRAIIIENVKDYIRNSKKIK